MGTEIRVAAEKKVDFPVLLFPTIPTSTLETPITQVIHLFFCKEKLKC